MNKTELICPICKQHLYYETQFTYYDCCGYDTSNKNVCINDKCLLSQKNVYWNDYGEFFSRDFSFEKEFGHKKYAALNSIAKQNEVEIYKVGLKSKKYFSPALMLFILKPYIEYIYKGDKYGNVLSVKRKLKFLKKGDNGYNIHYISGYHMLLYEIKTFKRFLKAYKKNYNNYFLRKAKVYQFKESFEMLSWDKRWWRYLSRFLITIFYKKRLKKIQKDYKFFETIKTFKYRIIYKEDFIHLKKISPFDIFKIIKLEKVKIDEKFLKQILRIKKIKKIKYD